MGLWNGRDPGILGIPIICTTWYYALWMLQVISMFVVLLLSLSRVIVIVSPFYKVNKQAVLWSVVIYFVYQSLWNVYKFAYGKVGIYYTPSAYCVVFYRAFFDTIFNLNYSICSAVSPIIVFAAFVVAIFKFREDHGISETSQRNNRQASVTITYFAALFLFCNLPTFLNNAMYAYTLVQDRYPGLIYNNNFMFFYSWLLSNCFCTILNAALNPVLYVWRMNNFRLWILGFF